ncbi:MAG: glycosyltransferase [Marinagarivorans sp.]
MVARQLVAQANRTDGEPHVLVLRRKRQTRSAQLDELAQQNIPFYLVPGWSHLATVFALVQLLKQLKPRVLIAHGFSEHLWGRLAAIIAGVPVILHVEHNSRERYTPFRLWLAKQLTKRTRWLVGVSEGVRNSLLNLGFAPEKCVFVNNGIDLSPYEGVVNTPWSERVSGIIMCSRFAYQKDHATLLHALAHLKHHYHFEPPLVLIGGGKKSLRAKAQMLAKMLGIESQVEFLGYCSDVPSILKKYTISVLSSRYEGFGLVLAEGMAAGCFPIGSAVPGIQEWLGALNSMYVVPATDVELLSARIAWVLRNPQLAEQLALQGQSIARQMFNLDRMLDEYNKLIS